jgi:ATP-binding cassette subfamily B protein
MKELAPVFRYLKKYKKKLFYGFFVVIISVGLQVIYPIFIGKAIDELTFRTGEYPIFYYALAIIGLTLFSGVFLFLTRKTIIVVSREIENDLRFDFFSHLQKLDRNFYNKNTTGDIMARATNDINNVRNFLGPGIMYSFQTFFRTVLTITILVKLSLKITLISLLPLPLVSIIVYYIMKLTYSRSMKVQAAFASMTTKAQETFSGIRVIKSYVREKYVENDFQNISKDYRKKSLALARMQAYSFPLMFVLTGLSAILVIYFGGMEVIGGRFTVGNIASFLVYLGQLTWPIIAFGWILNLVQMAAPSMKRLTNMMFAKPSIADSKETDFSIKPDDIKGKIEFRNVSFKYEGTDMYVLRNVNLKVESGMTLGIIGHTGSGKSTLVSLLPRLYDVEEGEVLIDDINVKKIPLDILRKSIGMVPQEAFLFSETLGNNIGYSSDIPEMPLIEWAAKVAGLKKDIELFPDKYNTEIGERGISLSGGQKQRAALARAIYRKPKILILDDSLSAVDTNTEEEILKELKNLMKDRTSLLISHRISTIRNADYIIVLSEGKIAEEGTHEELLGMQGIYYNIHLKQLLEEEIRETE